MKTIVRCGPRSPQENELVQRWRDDLEIAPRIDCLSVDVDISDPLFARLLEHTRSTRGATFTPLHTFSAKETAAARYLVLRPGSLFHTPEGTWRANRSYIDSQPIVSAHPGFHRRRLDRLLVGVIRTSKRSAFAIDDGICAIIVTAEMSAALSGQDFGGWTTAPLIHRMTQEEIQDWRLFVPTSVLPPLVKDASLIPVDLDSEDATIDYRRIGCLTYRTQDFECFDDVNVTDEALWDWQGYIIVSAEVGAFLKEQRARVNLEPVLETGSDLHRQYTEHWEQLTAVREVCSENEVW